MLQNYYISCVSFVRILDSRIGPGSCGEAKFFSICMQPSSRPWRSEIFKKPILNHIDGIRHGNLLLPKEIAVRPGNSINRGG